MCHMVIPIDELTIFSTLGPPSNPSLFKMAMWHSMDSGVKAQHSAFSFGNSPNRMEGASNKFADSARAAHTIK